MKNTEDILDSMFSGFANGKEFRSSKKAGGPKPQKKAPAVQKVLSKDERRAAGLRRVIEDPGATDHEKDNARRLLKKLEAKGDSSL